MAMTHALTIEPDQQQLLEHLAASELRSPEVLVREAIEEYVANRQRLTPEDRKAMEEHDAIWDSYTGPRLTDEEFQAKAESSWQHYERTGLHVTHEEVEQWLERLLTDPHAKLPECHT